MRLLLLAALAFGGGFTINAEILKRYGYTLEGYNAMTPNERSKVDEYIMAMEDQRQAAESARRFQEQQPKLELNGAEIESLSRLAPSSMFDKAKLPDPAGGSDWSASARLGNGEFSRFSVRNDAHDLELQFGDLAADGRSPLLGSSPYVNVKKGGAGSGKRLDYGYKLQLGVVDLSGRLYSNDAPALDRRIDQSLDILGDPKAAQDLSYSTRFEQQSLLVGSALGHVGRAYHLFGPVDVAWSAMGLARMTGPFPNLTLDQSAGARWRVNEDHTVGLFGGLTEAAGLFSKTIVRDSLRSGNTDLEPALDAAPHAQIAAWGKMPYLSSVQYTVEAGRQWNPWTTVQSAAASVSTGKFGVRGAYSDESGADVEFQRRKIEGGIAYNPSASVELSATLGNDHARLGNAEINNNSVMLGLTVRETVKPGFASTTLETLFTTGDNLLLPPAKQAEFARKMQEELSKLVTIKRTAEDLAGTPGFSGRWEELRRAWHDLDPESRRALNELGEGYPERIMSTTGDKIADYAKLVNLLSDAAVLDRVVVRAVRHQIQKNLEDLEVPLFGNKYKMKAPMVIAAAHAYSLGLRPLPGVTEGDARNGLDPFLTKKIVEEFKCAGDSDITGCVLGKLPPADADRLRKDYGADLDATLKEAVSWTSDVIRRELNALMLQVYMAADRLNELTVDGGARVGELNGRALMASFSRLDQRGRRDFKAAVETGRRREEEALKEADAALSERLLRYGRERLAWLHRQPAWPAGVTVAVRPQDWAPLLAAYGDERLFDVVLQAKAKGPRVLIQLNDDQFLNALSVIKGDPTVVKLPPRPPKGRVILH